MLRESQTAVIARNEPWSGSVTTEPYEAGWAGEAIFFVRALSVSGVKPGVPVRIQISPDGMRWADEGTRFELPTKADEVTFGRVRHFGNWLRIAADLPAGAEMKVVVTVHVK